MDVLSGRSIHPNQGRKKKSRLSPIFGHEKREKEETNGFCGASLNQLRSYRFNGGASGPEEKWEVSPGLDFVND